MIGRALKAQGHATAEFHVYVPRGGGIADALGVEGSAAIHFDRSIEQVAAAPDRDVHRMNAPTGDEADGEVANIPPGLCRASPADQVLRVGPEGHRPEPSFIIQARRDGDDLGGTPRSTGGRPDVDVLELADAAIADQRAGKPEGARGALLGAMAASAS